MAWRTDAGEIGAGHTVTAMYELVPAGEELGLPGVDPLKYQAVPALTDQAASAELLTLKIRYKEPDGETSRLLTFAGDDAIASGAGASDDFRFAAAVAMFGMKLRRSESAEHFEWAQVADIARAGVGEDAMGHRSQFLELVQRARELQTHVTSTD